MSVILAMKLKSLILTIGFLILTFMFISCSSQENNNKKLQKSFIEPPEKIMVYKNNEQIVIEKNSELYTKIVELANKRIKEPLDIAQLALQESSPNEFIGNETAVEFFYSEKMSSEFKSYNDKVLKKGYSKLLMVLSGNEKDLLIFGDNGVYYNDVFGRLLSPDDLLNLITQITESSSQNEKDIITGNTNYQNKTVIKVVVKGSNDSEKVFDKPEDIKVFTTAIETGIYGKNTGIKLKAPQYYVNFYYSDNQEVKYLLYISNGNSKMYKSGSGGEYHTLSKESVEALNHLLLLFKQNESNLTETTKEISERDIEEEKQVEMAISMAQKFCDDMTKSWLKLDRVDMSDYLVDNVNTHLVLNWIELDIADRKQNTWKQLKSIDKVLLNNVNFSRIAETQITYKTYVEIGYTRHEPSVNGIGINLTLNLEMVDGKWMITGADTLGSSIYREWKDSHYTTIEEMDEAFRNSCTEQGILLNIHKTTIFEKDIEEGKH